LVLFVRIGAYQWVTAISKEEFSPRPFALSRSRALPGALLAPTAPSKVGRILIFTSGEAKKSSHLPIRLPLPAAAPGWILLDQCASAQQQTQLKP
jgi:hypothetical protein